MSLHGKPLKMKSTFAIDWMYMIVIGSPSRASEVISVLCFKQLDIDLIKGKNTYFVEIMGSPFAVTTRHLFSVSICSRTEEKN